MVKYSTARKIQLFVSIFNVSNLLSTVYSNNRPIQRTNHCLLSCLAPVANCLQTSLLVRRICVIIVHKYETGNGMYFIILHSVPILSKQNTRLQWLKRVEITVTFEQPLRCYKTMTKFNYRIHHIADDQ